MNAGSIEFALRRAAARRNRRRTISLSAASLTIVGWLVNFAMPQIPGRSCDWITLQEYTQATLAPAMAMVAAVACLVHGGVSSLLVSRGIFWAGLALGAAGTFDEPGLAPIAAPLWALGCGVSLFASAETGLEPERLPAPLDRVLIRAGYSTVTTLQVGQLMVLTAVAIANRFQVAASELDVAGLLATCILGAGLASLTRLRAHSWIFAALSSWAVALLALTDQLWLPPTVVCALAAAALLQLTLAVLLTRALHRSDGIHDVAIVAHAGVAARGVALLAGAATVLWAAFGVSPADIAFGCTN